MIALMSFYPPINIQFLFFRNAAIMAGLRMFMIATREKCQSQARRACGFPQHSIFIEWLIAAPQAGVVDGAVERPLCESGPAWRVPRSRDSGRMLVAGDALRFILPYRAYTMEVIPSIFLEPPGILRLPWRRA